jgi:para-aminobenzoate synthetase component I
MNNTPLHRNKAIYVTDPVHAGILKAGMLNWANQFSILVFLDSNSYPSAYNGYECLLGVGMYKAVPNAGTNPLMQLQVAHMLRPDWMFGHICYDYKNITEPKLTSAHPEKHGYPVLQFFVPQTVCYINREQTTFTIETYDDPVTVYDAIIHAAGMPDVQMPAGISFTNITDRETYIDVVNRLRRHIADGDCYEVNYCGGGYAENVMIDPLVVFKALNKLSPAPFAAFYKLNDQYMMCASPERYLLKQDNILVSQPIKGTARRDKDEQKDELIKETLRADIKERAENVMIVDLVRNDLARTCETGSVQVDELFGIYSFPQVHQMISTVSGKLKDGLTFTDAIQASFPMGSMTGAPKFKVMQLIETYEQARRELFSGTIGYVTPQGDMDFNVVIRSLFYNATTHYLSYHTGGAITFDSDPQKEWEEMRLKAWALERLFSA